MWEIQVLACHLLKFQHSPFLDNWISSGNTDINNKKKPAQICFHSKRPPYSFHKNNITPSINIDGLIDWWWLMPTSAIFQLYRGMNKSYISPRPFINRNDY